MTLMRIPLPVWVLAAAVMVALVVGAVCAVRGRREDAEYGPYAEPLRWPTPPPP